MDRAHMASESDCFSKATVRTRSWVPEDDEVGGHQGRRSAHRTGRVHPDHRLAHGPEGGGQVELGHDHALEHVGGLADDHGVDVRPLHLASSRARLAASRTRPAMETSSRLARWWVCPTPMTAVRSAIMPSRQRPVRRQCADQVLLETRARGGVGQGRGRRSVHDPAGRLPDADQAGHHHPVGGQRAARGVDPDPVAEAQGVAQDQLLVGEGGVEFGHVDGRPAPSESPAASPAIRVEGEAVRSRAPREWVSIRWSIP